MARTHGLASCYIHASCRCDDCRRAMKERQRHYRAMRSIGEYECTECPMRFKTKSGKTQHYDRVHILS